MTTCAKHQCEMDVTVECGGCGGNGERLCDDYGVDTMVVCWRCNGSGYSPWPECGECLREHYEETYE